MGFLLISLFLSSSSPFILFIPVEKGAECFCAIWSITSASSLAIFR